MSDEKKKSFRTLNQYIRPKKVENFCSKYYRGNNVPIDVCRYHDTFGQIFYSTFAAQLAARENRYTAEKDGFSVVRAKSHDPYSRFSPYIARFTLAYGNVHSAPTATDFRIAFPDSPRGADSYLDMKHRVQKIIAFEKFLKAIEKFERRTSKDLEEIIENLTLFLRETDPKYRAHDYLHWRWLPKEGLPEQEIVGPHTPLLGARLDLAMVLLRGAYERVRGDLHGLYYGKLGRHGPKWRGLLTIRPKSRLVSDVPRYEWVFLLYSKSMGGITYKTYLLVGSKEGAKAKIKLRGRYPSYKDLTGPRFDPFRANLLREAIITRVLDRFGDRLDEIAKEAEKRIKMT